REELVGPAAQLAIGRAGVTGELIQLLFDARRLWRGVCAGRLVQRVTEVEDHASLEVLDQDWITALQMCGKARIAVEPGKRRRRKQQVLNAGCPHLLEVLDRPIVTERARVATIASGRKRSCLPAFELKHGLFAVFPHPYKRILG